MADILELSRQYRESGEECRKRLKEIRSLLSSKNLSSQEALELRRRVTMLTTMTRDCIAISIFLKNYSDRRNYLEEARKET